MNMMISYQELVRTFPYSPDKFIEKVKQYKSVQAYIAAELSGKRQ